jgi:hypothetical protein
MKGSRKTPKTRKIQYILQHALTAPHRNIYSVRYVSPQDISNFSRCCNVIKFKSIYDPQTAAKCHVVLDPLMDSFSFIASTLFFCVTILFLAGTDDIRKPGSH